MPPYFRAFHALRTWLDSRTGIGHVDLLSFRAPNFMLAHSYRLRDEERSNSQSITARGSSASLDGSIAWGDWSGGAEVAGGRGGFVAAAVMPMPVTSRDCVSPFAVKLTFVLAAAALVGVNLTVTAAVAPVPRSVKGLPESMLKGAGTEAVTVMVSVLVFRTMKIRVAEFSMVTVPKLTGPVGVTANIGLRNDAGDGRTRALPPVRIPRR